MTIEKLAQSTLPTRFGTFTLHVYRDEAGIEHMALVAGTPRNGCLVRVHSECATGDIMGSLRCDCRDQLEASLRLIAKAGEGVLVYLRGQEGRGIGLGNKIAAYALQDQGFDTVEANHRLGFATDLRDYSAGVAMLRAFGLSAVRLLTNNPDKVAALEQGGVAVVEREPLWTGDNPHNHRYLETKQAVMGHLGEARETDAQPVEASYGRPSTH